MSQSPCLHETLALLSASGACLATTETECRGRDNLRNSRSVFLIVFDGKVCGGVERKRKYRIWLMAALVVNLIVLAGFVMNNWYQEAQKTQDQGLTKVSADVADRHYPH